MGIGSMIGGAIGGVGGSFVGGIIDYGLGRQESNRAFARQKDLYKHQYQWMMEDMRRAGLNPILAAKIGPGNFPTVAMNPNTSPMATAANSAKNLTAAKKQEQETENLEVDNQIKKIDKMIKGHQEKVWSNTAKLAEEIGFLIDKLSKIGSLDPEKETVLDSFLDSVEKAGNMAIETATAVSANLRERAINRQKIFGRK
jgi:hypothetical protein